MVENAKQTKRQTKIDEALLGAKSQSRPAVQLKQPQKGLNMKSATKNKAIVVKIEQIERAESSSGMTNLAAKKHVSPRGPIGREGKAKTGQKTEYQKDYEIEWNSGVGRPKKLPLSAIGTQKGGYVEGLNGSDARLPEPRKSPSASPKRKTSKKARKGN